MGVFLGNSNSIFSKQVTYSTGIGSTPRSVAVGDFNSDLQKDLAVANFGTNDIRIFSGVGNGTFMFKTTINTESSRPICVKVADFNNDGRDDLATVNYGTNNIGIFLGYGNGTFDITVALSTNYDSSPISMAAGDFNHDNATDIVVANSGTNSIGIFFGYGNGSFGIQTIILLHMKSHPYFITLADFNDDSELDIVVVNRGSNTINIFLGHSNSAFSTQSYSTGNNSLPYSVAIGDYNKDNKLDIVVANYGTYELIILKGDGKGSFADQTTFFTERTFHPYSIVSADFNKDGRSDIAVVNYDTNYVRILLGSTFYSMSQPSFYSTERNSYSQSLALADFDNDSSLDIVVANYRTSVIGILFGRGNGTFSNQVICSTGRNSGPHNIIVDDINKDNQQDIIVANYWGNNLGIFLGYGDRDFSEEMTYSTGSGSGPSSVIVEDFNNDNQPDIAVTNLWTNNIGIFLGYGNGSFSSQIVYNTGYNSQPMSIASGDLNNDKRLDIVVANYWANSVGIFLGYGNGSFSKQITYYIGNGSAPSCIALGDFNKDNYLDIAVANSGTNTIGILLGYGNGTFLIQANYSTGNNSNPVSLMIEDFNNDNYSDIAVTNYLAGNIGVLFGHGDGSFSSQFTYFNENNNRLISIVAGDFNNDTLPDLAVANNLGDTVDILLGHSNGTFAFETSYSITTDTGPQFITVADLNHDNRLDVVLTNYRTGYISIFLGHDDGTFSNQTTYSTDYASEPSSIAVGDFNNDNKMDIVVANSNANNIGIFLGNGDGTFSNQVTYAAGSSPLSVTIGNFNNDNLLDIAVVNYYSNNFGIFLGHGDGSFSNQVTYYIGYNSGPRSIATADLNNDGYLDIAVANFRGNSFGVFLGYGNGTFASNGIHSTGVDAAPDYLVIGDVNNDTYLDIIVTNYYADNIGVFLGSRDASFSAQMRYPTGSSSRPCFDVIGDFNNDSRLDIAIVNCHRQNIGIFYGYGDGTFSNIITYTAGNGSAPQSIAVGDFDQDGLLDIVVANQITSNIAILHGIVQIVGMEQVTCSTGSTSHPQSIAVGDFNNDNRLDFAVGNYGTDSIGIFLQNFNETFPTEIMLSTGSLSFPVSIAVKDLNNDNQLDIVVANSGTDNICIFFGYGNGSFQIPTFFSTDIDSNPLAVAIGDFNSDSQMDIVVSNYDTRNIFVFLSRNASTFLDMVSYPTGTYSNPQAVAVNDLNNDGQLDIVVANKGAGNIGIFFGYGNGSFTQQRIFPTGSQTWPSAIALGDFNNDTLLDIAVAHYYSSTIGVFLGRSNGTLSAQKVYVIGAPSTPSGIALGDFNSDGQLDIVVAGHWSDSIFIFLGYGNGSFENKQEYSTGSFTRPWSVAVGDFNNDNQLDVVTANFGSNNVAIFLGNGDGTFPNPATSFVSVGSNPYFVIATDFNNDKKWDIAVVNYFSDNVGILLGYGNGTFEHQVNYSTGAGSGPRSIATGDFNSDGLPDIVVTNSLTNTVGLVLGFKNGTFFSQLEYSIADQSLPMSVAVGDFNHDGQLDMVIASFGVNNIDILFGYGHQTFLRVPPYSTGSSSQPCYIAVGDFDKDNRLDVAVANNNTDNIMVIFGSGDGTFSNQTVYFTGKGSHPYGIAIGDLNNDNHSDIVVANSGSDNIGIFLGYGNRRFSNQTIYFVGVNSKPQTVAILDIDNDTLSDIAVANSVANNIVVLFGYKNGSFLSQKIFQAGFGSHSFAIAVGDINKDNLSDIVVANNGNGDIDVVSMTCQRYEL